MNTIICIIDIFSLNQTVMVCNDEDNIRITQECLLGSVPEVAINMANQYDTKKVILHGNQNYAGELSAQMLSMNPQLDIDIMSKGEKL